MLDFIVRNKDWLFSGAGITVLGCVVWLVKHLISRRKRISAAVSDKVETPLVTLTPVPQRPKTGRPLFDFSSYLPNPTPIEIAEQLKKVAPFQERAVKQSYVGLRIRWKTRLDLVHHRDGSAVSLGCRYEGYVRFVDIETSINDYPFLKVAHEGQLVIVYGTIQRIDSSGPVVKADKLVFYEQEE